MILENYYWLFPKAVPERICNEIISFGKSCQEEQALVGKYKRDMKLNKKDIRDLKKKRDSQVVWLKERWVWNLIEPFVHEANRLAGWNFQWDYSEPSQFTKYNKNQYYGWHADSWPKAYDNVGGEDHGKIRKITSMLMLSDKSEYEGGDFEVDTRQEDPDIKKNTTVKKVDYAEKGTLICFPAFLWHRVKPVTKGTRYSMPTWHLGEPFK